MDITKDNILDIVKQHKDVEKEITDFLKENATKFTVMLHHNGKFIEAYPVKAAYELKGLECDGCCYKCPHFVPFDPDNTRNREFMEAYCLKAREKSFGECTDSIMFKF